MTDNNHNLVGTDNNNKKTTTTTTTTKTTQLINCRPRGGSDNSSRPLPHHEKKMFSVLPIASHYHRHFTVWETHCKLQTLLSVSSGQSVQFSRKIWRPDWERHCKMQTPLSVSSVLKSGDPLSSSMCTCPFAYFLFHNGWLSYLNTRVTWTVHNLTHLIAPCGCEYTKGFLYRRAFDSTNIMQLVQLTWHCTIRRHAPMGPVAEA